MAQCSQCKKKVTDAAKRQLGTEGICLECAETNVTSSAERGDEDKSINPDAMLSELSVREFTSSFKNELDDVIEKKVADGTKTLGKELTATKNNLKTAQQEERTQRISPNAQNIFERFKQ